MRLDVFVEFPPRDMHLSQVLQTANFVSSAKVKQSQIGDRFLDDFSAILNNMRQRDKTWIISIVYAHINYYQLVKYRLLILGK